MNKLDEQMRHWSKRLVHDLKIDESESKNFATTIAAQVRWLPQDAKLEIHNASPLDFKKR